MTKLDDKATATITIQVDPDTARLYNAASEEDRGKLKFMLRLWLRDLVTGSAPFSVWAEALRKSAKGKGANPEIPEPL